ncbi:MAG: isoaspartyl peptidase/L-asparaginase [Chlamydiota bacterium]
MTQANKWALAIHGGAANLNIEKNKEWWTESLKKEFIKPIEEALRKGKSILESGGSALDATQSAVVILEDCEWFNAGKGGLYSIDGSIELDASIMDGATGQAGAVGAVNHVKNPILLAREVLQSPAVLLVGEGAKKFAQEHHIEMVDQEYYESPLNKMLLAKARGEEQDRSWHRPYEDYPDLSGKYGTVGAVAVDLNGDLAAATSTGGVYTQLPGRVGDTGTIGAGTWADTLCAVSCTGDGEEFMKRGVAHDIAAKMRYLGLGLDEAVEKVIAQELVQVEVVGGVVAVDCQGNMSLRYNTDSMMRGSANSEGVFEVKLT